MGPEEPGASTRWYSYLDEVLGKQPYLAGERFTVADITAFAGLAIADFAKTTYQPISRI